MRGVEVQSQHSLRRFELLGILALEGSFHYFAIGNSNKLKKHK